MVVLENRRLRHGRNGGHLSAFACRLQHVPATLDDVLPPHRPTSRWVLMANTQDVQWNFAAANAASAALRRAAYELKRTADKRMHSAKAAQAEWRGKHRETFDGELKKLLSEAQELANEYHAAASRIDSRSA